MFCAVLLSLILLCLMIGIQQQNDALIITSVMYLITITLMQHWNLDDTVYIYSFVIFLIIVISWTLLQKYPMTEGFGIPSRPCTMYFTTDKDGCDQGYYSLSDKEFQSLLIQQASLLSQTPITSPNYNTEKQKFDILNKVDQERTKLKNNNDANGICKQEFPGWLEDPDQPEKIPYDDIKKRGALSDWAFCYRNVIPTDKPTALYNPNEVTAIYDRVKSQFGKHIIASVDTKPFTQSSKNINGTTMYSKADPEYARIYFKDWKADPDASCKNPTVDKIASMNSLTSITSRYGVEIGLTEDQTKITTISTIRPSPGNNNQLLYIGDYNSPNLDIIEKMFFDYEIVPSQGLILKPKSSIDTYLYRFYIDFCDQLMVPPKLPFNLKTEGRAQWNMSTITGYNTNLLTIREYPFGIPLPSEIIDASWLSKDPSRKWVNILPYNKIYTIEELRYNLQSQTNQLETYLNTISDTPYNSNEALGIGLVTKKYSLPPRYDQYRIRTLPEFKFDDNINLSVYLQNISITLGSMDGLSIPITVSPSESTYIEYIGLLNITTPGKYEFKLAFGPTNISDYPVDSTIVVEINNSVVASHFACTNYEECYSVFNVKCKKENECPIPLITDLQDKKASLIDRSLAVNNPKKIHNPVQLDIADKKNTLRIRIFTPKGTTPTPNICYVLYRKVNDVVIVNNQSVDNFRIIGRPAGFTIWQGYPNDLVQYRPYDIRSSLIKNMYVTRQILLNRNAQKQIEMRRIEIMKAFLQGIRTNPSTYIDTAKQLISQNNRIYAFFTNPALIPKTEDNDLVKIQQFNDNFTSTI